MRVLGDYVFYGNLSDHARCPYLTRLSDGRLILGMNILHGQPRLTHDWHGGQKPHYLIGRAPDKLLGQKPLRLSDRHGLPPYFFERSDGVLLAAYNSWKEFDLDAPPVRAILQDAGLRRFLSAFRDAKDPADPPPETDVRTLLGLDPGAVDTVGLLQPITILKSEDGAHTWKPLGKVYSDSEQKTGCAFRGNMLEVNGEILFSAYWPDKGDRRATVFLMRSRDGGATWDIKSAIARPWDETSGSETHLYRHPTGRITALMRTTRRYLGLAHSDDNGATWTPPVTTTVYGFPCHALPHSSGRVLLTYAQRAPPAATKGRLVSPDLSDIETSEEFTIDQYAEPTAGGGGYPSAVELDDGSVLVAYFSRRAPYSPPWICGRRIVL